MKEREREREKVMKRNFLFYLELKNENIDECDLIMHIIYKIIVFFYFALFSFLLLCFKSSYFTFQK